MKCVLNQSSAQERHKQSQQQSQVGGESGQWSGGAFPFPYHFWRLFPGRDSTNQSRKADSKPDISIFLFLLHFAFRDIVTHWGQKANDPGLRSEWGNVEVEIPVQIRHSISLNEKGVRERLTGDDNITTRRRCFIRWKVTCTCGCGLTMRMDIGRPTADGRGGLGFKLQYLGHILLRGQFIWVIVSVVT